MKMNIELIGSAVAVGLICLALPSGALAGEGMCSNATLRGEYGALVRGIKQTPPGTPVPTETFVGIALRNFDGNGSFVEEAASQNGVVTGPIGGVGPKAFPGITGTYQVNPDCTGTSTLVLPMGLPQIVSDFVIVNNGKKILEIVTSPRTNVATAVYTKK
jgi:hypothetical protein